MGPQYRPEKSYNPYYGDSPVWGLGFRALMLWVWPPELQGSFSVYTHTRPASVMGSCFRGTSDLAWGQVLGFRA